MSVSIPRIYNGMYIGTMPQAQADLIMQCREMKVVSNLKHMIFDFDAETIQESVEKGVRARDLVVERGENLNDYVSELRDYQTVGTAFMYLSPRSILGDGVGLGKTAEIAALINFLKIKGELTRFLMAVENSAWGQTLIEMVRFTGLNIVALPTQKKQIEKCIAETDWRNVDGIIMCHSTLKSNPLSNWIALNIAEDGRHCKLFNTFILDESSVIKNTETKMYEYTRNIAALCDRVHFLNATVFETRLMDIYNQTDMMNPELLPRKSKIDSQFCKFERSSYWKTEYDPITHVKKPVQKFVWNHVGYKNQFQFRMLLRLFYFGRCKADVGLNIPHVYKVYEVEASAVQKMAIANGFRYPEVLNCPSLIPEMGVETNRKNVPKMDRLLDIVENEFPHESVFIYCFHRQAQLALVEELKKIGRKPEILNGDTTTADRLAIQQRMNRGESDVIVTSIKKSLNLHGCDICILYSMETNVAKMEQIRGRIDRNVDDRVKTFIMLYYKDTGESEFLHTVVKQRAKDARDLTIDAKTAANAFMEAMELGGED